MLNIRTVLEKKEYTHNNKKINIKWEKALEFCNYLGFPDDRRTVIFILGLIKKYGEDKVFSLKSYFKDLETPPKNFKSLMVWKLQG